MDEYFERVYAPHGGLFFERCRFACVDGAPVGTCFVWKAYGRVNTVHWFKVLRAYEGRGIGRALLTDVLGALGPDEHAGMPAHAAVQLPRDQALHRLRASSSSPTRRSARAQTTWRRALPALRQRRCRRPAYAALGFARAPRALLDAAAGERFSEF